LSSTGTGAYFPGPCVKFKVSHIPVASLSQCVVQCMGKVVVLANVSHGLFPISYIFCKSNLSLSIQRILQKDHSINPSPYVSVTHSFSHNHVSQMKNPLTKNGTTSVSSLAILFYKSNLGPTKKTCESVQRKIICIM